MPFASNNKYICNFYVEDKITQKTKPNSMNLIHDHPTLNILKTVQNELERH